MFLGPLLHSYTAFKLPYAGGCDLGARTIEPHLQVLRRFGLDVVPTDGFYNCTVDQSVERPGRSPSPNAATPSPRTRCSLRRCREG